MIHVDILFELKYAIRSAIKSIFQTSSISIGKKIAEIQDDL